MKKWTTLWIMVMMLGLSVPAMGAMSISKMRQNTRFLTDRMAYELKLSPQQYDDVYEEREDMTMLWSVITIFLMFAMTTFAGYYPVLSIVVS